jgi:hypothetical protein
MMTDNEQFIVEFARILSDRELVFEIRQTMDRACEINNSGLFRAVEIMMNEHVRRRPDLAEDLVLTEFRQGLRRAIAATGRHGDNKYSLN